MRKFSYVALITAAFLTSHSAFAQEVNSDLTVTTTIFDAFQEPSLSKGKVVVNQDPSIKKMVGVRLAGDKVQRTGNDAFIKVQGFRAQVLPEINGFLKMKHSKGKKKLRKYSLS